MRRLLMLFTFAAALAHAPHAAAQGAAPPSAAGGEEAAAWARYTYPGDEFSVELPGMPYVMHTDRGVDRIGMKREKVRVFGRYSGGVVFFLVAYDRPRSSETFGQFASYLRGSWDVSPKGEATLGGFEGRAYEVKGRAGGRIPQELHGEARVFVMKKHAYLALALSQEEARPEVRRFLDSLTLGPNPAGERVAESAPVPRFKPPRETDGAPGDSAGAGSGGGEGQPRLVRPEVGAPARDPNARKAVIVYKPEPAYTEEGRRSVVRGAVRLRVVLSSTGEVKDISVIKGLSHGLTESAVGAARHMLFFPATKDGRPISQHVVLEYAFNIY
jgi:TonB family protein